MVIDPHGDLAAEIALFPDLHRRGAQSKLVYIDPLLSPEHSPCFNPFQLPDPSERKIAIMSQELRRVLEVLLAEAQPTSAMGTLLHACIATLLRRPGSSLEDLQRFMSDKRNADLVALGMRSPNPQHAKFFRSEF